MQLLFFQYYFLFEVSFYQKHNLQLLIQAPAASCGLWGHLKEAYGVPKNRLNQTCGLYYKHVTIVNDNSNVVSKWSFKLIDDPRAVIYDRNRFVIQATEACITNILQS
jgi:hypothetical protein